MPGLPMICERCGSLNAPFVTIDASSATVSNIYGQCEYCGGKTHFPPGTYNFVGNTIEFLFGPQRSVDELKKLEALLKEAWQNKITREELAKKLSSEAPEFKPLINSLPKENSKLLDFVRVLTVILSFATTSYNAYTTFFKKENFTKEEVQQIIDEAIEKSIREPNPIPPLPKTEKEQSPPNNGSISI